MRITKRLIRSHYGQAQINKAYQKIEDAMQEWIDSINKTFAQAIEEGRMQLFENDEGTITSPLIHLDLKTEEMSWENVRPK